MSVKRSTTDGRRRRADAARSARPAPEQRAESRQRTPISSAAMRRISSTSRALYEWPACVSSPWKRIAGERAIATRQPHAVGIVGIDAGAVIAAVDFQKDVENDAVRGVKLLYRA